MPVPTANYTGTHAWPSQAIDNYVLGQHGTAVPATNPEFRRGGGVVGTAPGTYADGVDVVSWVDRRGFSNPTLIYSLYFLPLRQGRRPLLRAHGSPGWAAYRT